LIPLRKIILRDQAKQPQTQRISLDAAARIPEMDCDTPGFAQKPAGGWGCAIITNRPVMPAKPRTDVEK